MQSCWQSSSLAATTSDWEFGTCRTGVDGSEPLRGQPRQLAGSCDDVRRLRGKEAEDDLVGRRRQRYHQPNGRTLGRYRCRAVLQRVDGQLEWCLGGVPLDEVAREPRLGDAHVGDGRGFPMPRASGVSLWLGVAHAVAEFGAGADAEFAIDAGQVDFDGLWADEQCGRN